MLSILHKLGFAFILLSSITLSFSSKANCIGCESKSNLILFPKNLDAVKQETRFAWNFLGLQGIDYARMLEDETYAQSILYRDDNASRVSNYITNAAGKILAQVSEQRPSLPSGGVFAAAGLTSAPLSWDFSEATDSPLVFFQINDRWETLQLKIYKKLYSGRARELSLTEISTFSLPNLKTIYLQLLEKNSSQFESYARDKQSLAISFSHLRILGAQCPESGYAQCFKLRAFAKVPKNPLPDNFSDRSILVLGIKEGWFSKELKLISFQSLKD